MSLQDISQIHNAQGLNDALKELQGLSASFVAGAAAGTKMNIAALRKADNLLGVLVGTDAGGAWTNDVANCTVQDTHATGTLTFASIANNDTFTVNGVVYTFKDTPTAINHIKRTAGNDNANAAAASSAINSFENRRLSTQKPNTPAVVATVANNVVTVTAYDDGAGNAPNVTNSAHATVTNNQTADVSATCASVVDGDTITVNGIVFTAKNTIAAASPAPAYGDKNNPLQAKVGGATADNNGMAAEFARVINKYETVNGTLDVVASAVGAVLHIKPRTNKKGNLVDISAGQGTITASGATLAGGTATGGIKSTTNLASKSLFVIWFNKDGK